MKLFNPSLATSLIQRLIGLLPASERVPAVGAVRFGSLRRLSPISRHFGYDRGAPVDRYYIEQFLLRHSDDIAGRVLEIGDDDYTQRFGGANVSKADVLHVHEDNPRATLIGDLVEADHLPSDAFDCFVLTQTLHLVYELRQAVATVRRLLKPGGVVLATVPGISQISADEWADYWCWSLTPLSARRLFAEAFAGDGDVVEVLAHGNVLAATAFLHGLAHQELRSRELDHYDPCYPVLITIRATKGSNITS